MLLVNFSSLLLLLLFVAIHFLSLSISLFLAQFCSKMYLVLYIKARYAFSQMFITDATTQQCREPKFVSTCIDALLSCPFVHTSVCAVMMTSLIVSWFTLRWQVLERICQMNGWGVPIYQLNSTMSSDGTKEAQLFLFKVCISTHAQTYTSYQKRSWLY